MKTNHNIPKIFTLFNDSTTSQPDASDETDSGKLRRYNANLIFFDWPTDWTYVSNHTYNVALLNDQP